MFFTTNDNLPEGVGFKTFGLTHILWLCGALIFYVAACILYRRLSAQKQRERENERGYVYVIQFSGNLLHVGK